MKVAILLLFGIGAILLLPLSKAAPCPAPASGSMVKVPGYPFGIAVSRDGCWMFVSTMSGKQDGNLVVLHDTAGTYPVERSIGLGGWGGGEVLTRDEKLLVVTAGTTIEAYDVQKLERPAGTALVGTLDAGRRSGAIYAAVSPDDQLLFVSEEYADRIAVYDLRKWRAGHFRGNPLVGYVPAASGPVGLAFSPRGKWLYATSEAALPNSGMQKRCVSEYYGRRSPPGLLLRIDVSKAATDPARSVANVVEAECSPVRVAVSPDGTSVWVTARGSGELLRISTSVFESHTASAGAESIHVGGEPVGIAIRPDGRQVWVGLSDRFEKNRKNSGHQLVGLVVQAPNATAGSIKLVSEPAFDFPRQLRFLPDGRTLAVGLFRASRIEFIATPP